MHRWVGQSGIKSRQKAARGAGSVQGEACGQQDRGEVDIGMNLLPYLAVLGLGLIVQMEHRATGMLGEQMASTAIYYSQGLSSGLSAQLPT